MLTNINAKASNQVLLLYIGHCVAYGTWNLLEENQARTGIMIKPKYILLSQDQYYIYRKWDDLSNAPSVLINDIAYRTCYRPLSSSLVNQIYSNTFPSIVQKFINLISLITTMMVSNDREPKFSCYY